jgi:hypothetical protein
MVINGFFKKYEKYFIPTFFFISSQFAFLLLYFSKYTIDEQAYFYTLSTISQTLAALIGIIGIFVIFRLQMLKSKKFEYTSQLRKLISGTNLTKVHPFIGLDASYSDNELLNTANIIYEKQLSEATQSPELDTFYSIVVNLRDNNSKYESYKKSISFSIFMATFAIIMSIILLPFGSIKLHDQNIFPLGSPLYAVGTVVSITLAALFALVQSFYELLMSEFD